MEKDKLIISYKNNDLDIFLGDKEFVYDINKDIDIDSLRDSFNAAIGALSLKNHSLEYWLLGISERNTLVNNLFLDTCLIRMVESLAAENEDLKLFTNNISLYIYFKENSKISIVDRLIFNLKKIFIQTKPYAHLIGFCIKTFIFR